MNGAPFFRGFLVMICSVVVEDGKLRDPAGVMLASTDNVSQSVSMACSFVPCLCASLLSCSIEYPAVLG